MCALRAALAIGRFACVHAGATWTSRTTSAPWAARYFHTSVVDAAGAIYVIGGVGSTSYQDVWASTDGGAHRSQQGHSTGHLLRAPVGVPFGTPSAPLEYRYARGTHSRGLSIAGADVLRRTEG